MRTSRLPWARAWCATASSPAPTCCRGLRSVYAWKGAVERGDEAVAILKTRTGLEAQVGAALRDRHPYETPIILFIRPDDADPATLAWLLTETGG